MEGLRRLSIACMAICALAEVHVPAASNHSQARPEKKMITILHTNDIHGHVEFWKGWEGSMAGRTIGGFDRLAAAIKKTRSDAGEGNVLLLDAGDAIGDTMIAAETGGRAVLSLLEQLAYDAMTLGNHEPDYGGERLEEYLKKFSIPFVAANVVRKSTGRTLVRPFMIKSVAGSKVGVLGLAYPNTPLTTASKNVQDLHYRQDSAEVVREFVPKMKDEGAELIVVLSHLGLAADLKLAAQAQDVNLIVGGHSHNRMEQVTWVENVAIVQAGAHCSDLGRVDLALRDGRWQVTSRELTLLDHAALEPDRRLTTAMRELLQPVRERLNEQVGTAAAPIIRAQTFAGQAPRKRDAESPADLLFADILREQTDCDIALLPGVGYGVAIPAGPITASALRNLLPHDSEVVTVSLSGEQIRSILEQAVTNVFSENPRVKVGGMIQVSGLTFAYDPHKTPAVQRVSVGAAPLDPAASYTVATNSMLSEGGHNYRTFTNGRRRQKHGRQYEMIAGWIRAHSPVRTPTLGRIQRAQSSQVAEQEAAVTR